MKFPTKSKFKYYIYQGWSWHPEVLFHSHSGYSKEQTVWFIRLAQDTSGRQKCRLLKFVTCIWITSCFYRVLGRCPGGQARSMSWFRTSWRAFSRSYSEVSVCRHSKSKIFVRGQNFSYEILRRKKCKNISKNHFICVKHEEKNCKRCYNAKKFSLRMQISRFCANSDKFCAVARPWDRDF